MRIVAADVPLARTRVVLGALTRALRWCGPYQAGVRRSLRVVSGERLSVDGEVTDAPPVAFDNAPRVLTAYRPSGRGGPTG